MTASSGYWLWDYGTERKALRWFVRGFAIAVFFAVWELIGRRGDYFAIVPATTTIAELWSDLPELGRAMLGTLTTAAIGYVLGALVGVLVGSLIGLSRLGRATLDPLINAGVVTPMTMLIPVIGIYVGLGFRGKVFFVFLFVVFVVAINTSVGVADTPKELRETADAFVLGRWERYRKVIVPFALPLILTGLRLAAGRAVQGAIIADLLLEVNNVGGYLIEAGSRFQMSKLLAGTFFTAIVAASVMLIARLVERHALRWLHP
jgi:NitT/TauT family transport system permease protein